MGLTPGGILYFPPLFSILYTLTIKLGPSLHSISSLLLPGWCGDHDASPTVPSEPRLELGIYKKNSQPNVLEVLFIQTNQRLLSPFQWFTLKWVEHTSTKIRSLRKLTLERTIWTVSAEHPPRWSERLLTPALGPILTLNQRRVLKVEGKLQKGDTKYS